MGVGQKLCAQNIGEHQTYLDYVQAGQHGERILMSLCVQVRQNINKQTHACHIFCEKWLYDTVEAFVH